jgi:hypothetical protein
MKKKQREQEKLPEAKETRSREEQVEPRRSKRSKRTQWKQLLKISGFETTTPKRKELQQEPRKRTRKKTKRSIMTVKTTRVQPRLTAIMKNTKAINSARWEKYQDEGDE